MRVLLTGGYGCIGSWVVRNLLARGEEAWIYDLKEDTHRLRQIIREADLARVHFVPGDVTDLPGLRKALQDHRISHILHLAGLQVPVCKADPLLGARVNVLGTLAVFEAVRLSEGRIERLVYASSAAVFGPPQMYGSGSVLDDVPLLPSTHYGAFKCCNEANARVYFQDHGLSSVGLRPWTVYGVGRDFGMTSEPTVAIQAVACGKPYHITYGGLQDLQYVDDVARTFLRCLEAPYTGAKSYNVRGHVVDLPDFVKVLCDVEPAARTLITHGNKQIAIAYDLDDQALQRDLGPMPRTSLHDGIRQTLELFRQQPS